ncbi:hypothetical protein ABPG77_002525 [Micractinium sp. CCAP 211/92]
MPGGRESPLTPAASWAPSGSGGSEGVEVQRSKSSTFARLGRSVSKLGGSRKARSRQQAAIQESPRTGDAVPQMPSPDRAAYRRGDGDIPGPSVTFAGGISGGRVAPRGSGTGSSAAGGSSAAARLRLFEEGRFDMEANLGSLSEKGVETLRADLAQLDGEVSAQLKAAVAANYTDFTRATPGILRLEGEFQQLRNLLHTMGDVVEGLKDAAAAVSAQAAQAAGGATPGHRRRLSGSATSDSRAAAQEEAEAAWRSGGDGAKWLECLDDTDVAVAERRLTDALHQLRRLDKLLARFVAAADRGDPGQQARLDSLGSEVEQRREQLIAIAEQQVLQPTAASADICAGADLLSRVAGRPHAHAVVLEAHAAKLKRRQAALVRPASSGGGDADGSDYAAALGQKLGLCLAAAADDVAAVFGPAGGDAELAAAFLVWALHQTERACHLLRKHALMPFAAPAGLHAFGRCTFAFAAHCAALEASHGLQLVPTVQRELWPTLEQVLARRVRKVGEALRRAVPGEVDALAAGATPLPRDLASWECLSAAFPSADFLLDELEAVAGEGRRLHSPRLEAALRKVVSDLFQLYTASLAAALNRAIKAPGAIVETRERLAAASEAAMELSTLLLERFLPEALAPLTDVCGDLASGPALGEHLLRMGEALGMAVVPLTPGGSLAIVPGGGEPPEQGQTGRDAMQSEEGELEEGEELQPNGARLSAPASTESSEATRQRTTSE